MNYWCVPKTIFSFSLLFIFWSNGVFAQVNVTTSNSAAYLAQKLVGAGVVMLNPTLNCPTKAGGSFKTIIGGVGLDSGIILTTGMAATQGNFNGINGPSGSLASTNNNSPGDASLNTLAGQNTFDACTLEFDFVPKGDSVHFNYVFSSEEYISATCGPYNDAFAFFISGPGIVGQKNMALVPSTNIPVTINSINSGVPGNGYTLANCYAMGAGSPFTAYYVNNANGPYITHRGFTTVLAAKYSVIPCSTYHLKMVIADAGNALYDSGVFIEAGSLQASNAQLQTNAGLDPNGQHFIVKGCTPAIVKINKNLPTTTPQTFHLSYSGTALQGTDINTLPDSLTILANNTSAQFTIVGLPTPMNGTKTLNVRLISPYYCDGNNTVLDSISLFVFDTLSMRILTNDTSICIGDTIPVRVKGDNLLQYNWTPNNQVFPPNIKEPLLVPYQPTTYLLTATLPASGCTPRKDSIRVWARPTPSIIANDITACSHLPLLLNIQVNPPYAGYQFIWTGPLGFLSTQKQPIINDPKAANSGGYSVTIQADTSQCHSSAQFQIQIITPDTPSVVTPQAYCQITGQEITMQATGSNLLWYFDDQGSSTPNAPVINTTNVADYHFFVTQVINGCESSKVPIEVEVKKCCDGNLMIPTAFTPNNDGKNDEWHILSGLGYKLIQINIFNRWGQLVFHTLTHEAWDGKFGGVTVDIGSYAYEILIECDITGNLIKKTGLINVIR